MFFLGAFSPLPVLKAPPANFIEIIPSSPKIKLEDLIDKYSSLDSNSLMQEFIKLTLEKKKRGELSSSEINNLKNMLLPYLNEEQRKNLERLLNVVNNV